MTPRRFPPGHGVAGGYAKAYSYDRRLAPLLPDLIRQYAAGHSLRQLSRAVGVSVETLGKRLAAAGVPLRSAGRVAQAPRVPPDLPRIAPPVMARWRCDCGRLNVQVTQCACGCVPAWVEAA